LHDLAAPDDKRMVSQHDILNHSTTRMTHHFKGAKVQHSRIERVWETKMITARIARYAPPSS